MSRTYSAITDKYQNKLKLNYHTDNRNPQEPRDHRSDYLNAEIEIELLEDCGPMRQQFRRLAQKMRSATTAR